ncbi:MAG: phospholipid carrier-dependent glycosyltransferase [Bacteroidota bacterium]
MKKNDWPYFIVILALFVGCYTFTFNSKVEVLGDNAKYYTLGKSLASGTGYTDLSNVSLKPDNYFPPGYPVIVATSIKFSTGSFKSVKITNGILLLASAFIVFLLFDKLTQEKNLAVVIAALFLMNSHFLYYASLMMSEITFTFFSLLTLYFLVQADFQKSPWKEKYFWFSLLALSYSYHTRTIGIALFGGILLFLIVSKNWKYLLSYFAGFVVLALPWYLRGKSIGSNSYLTHLFMKNRYRPEEGVVSVSDMINRFGENFQRYLTKEIPNGIFPFVEVDYKTTGFGDWMIGLVIVGLIVYGITKLGEFNWLLFSYLLGTFGILLLWPEIFIGVRLVLPVIPILMGLFIYGLYQLIIFSLDKLTIKFSFNPLILSIFILFFLPEVKALNEKSYQRLSTNWKNYYEVAEWAKKNTPEGSVIACRKPSLFHLYSERFTNYYKYTPEDQVLLEDLKKKQVDYVVIDQLGYSSTVRYLYPAVQNNPLHFQVVYKTDNPETYLLKFQYP